MLHNFLSFDDNADNTYSKVHSNLSFYCHVFIKPIPTNEKTIFHCHFLLLLTNCEISRRQQSCIIKVWKAELCRQRFKFLPAGDNFFCFRRNFSPLRRRSVVCEPEGGSMISHAEQRKYLPRGACSNETTSTTTDPLNKTKLTKLWFFLNLLNAVTNLANFS